MWVKKVIGPILHFIARTGQLDAEIAELHQRIKEDIMRNRQPREPRKLMVGTVYDFVASMMILIPCAILMGLESRIPGVKALWGVSALCAGMYLCALAINRIRCRTFTLGNFLYKNGGFVLLFGMILYRTLTV